MEEEKKQGLSRRAFLGLGGTALAGAAVAGLAGCAPQSGGDAAKATTEGASGGTTGGMPVAESGASAGPDVAGMHSWEIAPEAISADKIANTEDCDVLVIGAGLGGCCATIAALEEGAKKVITIDKNPETVVARGVHIAGFHTKVQQGLVDQGLLEEPNYNNVVRRWINWAQGRVKEPLLWEFARKSGACFDWLYDLATKKNLEALLWDGYYKGPDYTEYPVTHIFYQADKYEETINFTFYQGSGVGDVYGNAVLVPALYETIADMGGEIRWSTKSERLVRDRQRPGDRRHRFHWQGRVHADQREIGCHCFGRLRSRRRDVPVLLAHDRLRHGRALLQSARLRHRRHAQAGHLGGCRHAEVRAARGRHAPRLRRGQLRFPARELGRQALQERGREHPVEEKDAWTIYDSHGLEQVKTQMDAGLGGGLQWGQLTQPVGGEYNLEAQQIVLEGEIEKGQTVKADSLKELAQKMDVPPENLEATVARYNELCDLGKDLDFGKRPEVMGKVQDPPFYAGKLVASLLTMCGGLRTNVDAQVLDAEDQPIEGLYVCGSAAGEFFGAGDYPTYVPGIGHGRCVTFGRIAGINAAGGDAEAKIPSLDI